MDDGQGGQALSITRAADYEGIQSPTGLLQADVEYTFSMRAKLAAGGPASTGVRFVVKPNYNWVANTTINDSGWTTITGTHTLPGGVDPADSQIYISSTDQTGPYTILIDDILITRPDTGGCLANVTVTTNADSGPGSLRQAIADACAGGTINFDNDYTTLLASELAIDKDLTVDGVGHTVTVSGNHVTRIFNVTAGTVAFNNLTIANGSTYWGGGIHNDTGGTLNVTNSTLSNNESTTSSGGGIYNRGTLNVTNSTFSGNKSNNDVGGGIYSGGTLNVTNSTFSGNSAYSYGGGIHNDTGGTLNVTNSTFSGNSAQWGGGINNWGILNYTNTIIANSSGGGYDCQNDGTIGANTNNLVEDMTCAYPPGINFHFGDPLLGALNNYGGSTETFPLLPGSPAINAGDSATCANAATVNSLDQRGVTRPAACDIGAFESQGFTLVQTGSDGQSAPVNTAFTNPLALSVTSPFNEPVNGGQITFTPPYDEIAVIASAVITGSPATITAGAASVSATANGMVGGPYNVVTSAAGVDFALTNIDPAPTVVSSLRASPNPTSASSVDFTVTFSEPVTGVDTSDFTLTIAGITGATVTNVSGSGATCTVTVNTGSGNGPLRLDVLDDDTIIDSGSNPLNGAFTSGESYTIQKIGNINVSIGGASQGDYDLSSSQSMRQSYAGVNNGPVKVFSSGVLPIIASGRTLYYGLDGAPTSFVEMLGVPDNQLSTTWWLPWYKNVGDGIDTQLRIGNVSGAPASVHVYVAGVEMAGSPFSLTVTGAGQSTRLSFAGVNAGPVQIVSDVDIVVSERLLYSANGTPTSFTEMLGVPESQLHTTWWLPWYKNVGDGIDTQLRLGNVSGAPATVHVYIGGVEMTGSPFGLTATGAGQSTRLSFAGVNADPVQIVSDVKIVASQRLLYSVNKVATSFTEMLGVPDSQLNTTWWLPWYKNVGDGIDTQLRFGTP